MRTPLLSIRVDADTKQRWAASAARAGESLAEFIRVAVEERVGGEQILRGRKPVAMAANEPAPEPTPEPVVSAPRREVVAPLDTFRPDFKKGKGG